MTGNNSWKAFEFNLRIKDITCENGWCRPIWFYFKGNMFFLKTTFSNEVNLTSLKYEHELLIVPQINFCNPSM